MGGCDKYVHVKITDFITFLAEKWVKRKKEIFF